MTKCDSRNPLKGYLLLPPSPVPGYRGVDRNPFVPTLLEEEMDPLAQVPEGNAHVWEFYPPGWRRDAYRIYEENLVEGTEENLLYLLSGLAPAREILKVTEPHLGSHEIVACEVWNLNSFGDQREVNELVFLGYDLAYPGGDFYSAVLNGLFINPAPILVSKYKPLLNNFGLFSDMAPLPEYVQGFRAAAPSEANSDFSIFRLRLTS